MNKEKISRAIDGLDADGLDIQSRSIEEIHEVFVDVIERILTLFESTDNPYLVAERMSRFGSIVIAPLERLLDRITDDERRALASLVLLSLGSQKGIGFVIRELIEGRPYEGLAAKILMSTGNPRTADALITRLRSFSREEFADLKNSVLLGQYLQYLRTLGHELPDDLSLKLKAAEGTEAYPYLTIDVA